MVLGTSKRLNRNLLKSITPHIMPVQSLAGIRHRCPAVLNDPECASLVWIGVYGPFSRNPRKPTCGINVIIGYRPDFDRSGWREYSVLERFESRATKIFGRKVDVIPMLTQKVLGYQMLEGLLTCITVYGPKDWHDSARIKARKMLDEGYGRLRKAYGIMDQIEQVLESTNKNVTELFVLLIC